MLVAHQRPSAEFYNSHYTWRGLRKYDAGQVAQKVLTECLGELETRSLLAHLGGSEMCTLLGHP